MVGSAAWGAKKVQLLEAQVHAHPLRQARRQTFFVMPPSTRMMAPVVKPEVLQVVDLAEGMLKCTAFIEFRIENAGVKTFRLQSPAPFALS